MLDLPGDMALLCYPPLQCSVPEQPWHPPAAAWPLCATVLSCLPALLGPRPAGPIDGQAQGTLGGRQKRGRGREGEGKKREKGGRGKEKREGREMEGKMGGKDEKYSLISCRTTCLLLCMLRSVALECCLHSTSLFVIGQVFD